MQSSPQNISRLPTIIGLADSPHYLVGSMNEDNDFVALSQAEGVAKFNSLSSAKDYLKSINYSSASLAFQTPYDEMCGNESSKQCTQTIRF